MEAATLEQATKILSIFRGEPREQVQALLASGLLADLRDANFNEAIDRDALRRILGLKPLYLLLEEIGTVTILATTEQFVAREKFVCDTSGVAKVKIPRLNDKFQRWFLGKNEDPMPKTELHYAKLVRSAVNGPILRELGDKAETTLAQIYALMEQQPNGEQGVLLTNGWANIFYVLDINGELRTVEVGWDDGSWRVLSISVTDRFVWRAGVRVFYRSPR